MKALKYRLKIGVIEAGIKMRVLVFRPAYDQATLYGHAWLGEIVDAAIRAGHEVMDLEGINANQERFLAALKDFAPDLVFAVGHGRASTFSGQNDEPVFQACSTDRAMSGYQGVFISCLMGTTLAPSMNMKGAEAVAAYTNEFIWMVHPDPYYGTHILEDPYADPVRRTVVDPAVMLLNGASWREWYEASIALNNQGIRSCRVSDPFVCAQIRAALEQNRDSLVVYGKEGSFVDVDETPMIISAGIGVGLTLLALFA